MDSRQKLLKMLAKPKKDAEYASNSSGMLGEQPKAPVPGFALSEERAASPEYQEARKLEELGAMQEQVGQMADQMSPKIAPIAGMDPEMIMGAGNIAGSISKITPNILRAASAAEGVAKSAAMAPSKFGRIIQVMKDRPNFVSEKVVPVGKVIRAKK